MIKPYQIQEIKRRSSLYHRRHDDFATREDHNVLNGKTAIILADDGAATAATVIAAARWIKKKTNNPKSHLIIAVLVFPKQTKELLKREGDHVEVILSPSTSNFKSVGQYYQSFEPVTDEQVIEIMKRNRS